MARSDADATPAVADKGAEDEAALLARLQSQFGDINVNDFLGCDGQSNNNDDDDASSSSSDAVEPTPEELLAWQEEQFKKGQMKLEAKKMMESTRVENVHKSALQRRRQKKTASERTMIHEYERTEEAHEWESLATMPNLGNVTSLFFPASVEDGELVGGVHPLLKALVEKGDAEVLGTSWRRLFSSADGDGLSFRNLCKNIWGYEGPTVTLIGGEPSATRLLSSQDSSRGTIQLGFFTTDTWIESTEYFGSGDDCFLFSLDDNTNNVQIFRPKLRANNFKEAASSKHTTKPHMYCHPSSFATSNHRRNAPNKTNGSLHGIGIGGTPSQPRLHLTESLEECRGKCHG